GVAGGVDGAGGVRRGAARPARVRLLRLTARALHRRGGGDLPVLGAGHPALRYRVRQRAIAVSTTVSSPGSPAAPRISMSSPTIASVTSCGSSKVLPSDSTEMLSWST